MALVTRILLIRHGKSEGNFEHRFQGRDDSRLSELGIKQSESLRKAISVKIDAVYHSPLERARHTAEMVFPKIDKIKNQDLIERSFGVLDGLTLGEARRKHAGIDEFYHGRQADIEVQGVEKISEVQERSFAAFEKIARKHPGQTIAIVGHLFWIKSLLSKIMGVPFHEIQKIKIANTSVTVVTATHSSKGLVFKVEKIGDKSHLQDDY